MSKSKYTPGNWRVSPIGAGFEVEDSRGQIVAQTQQLRPIRGPQDHEERRANSRLIAKCPEMLEALKKAERNVTMLCNYCEKELGGATYTREMVDKWRTLIREAEGE